MSMRAVRAWIEAGTAADPAPAVSRERLLRLVPGAKAAIVAGLAGRFDAVAGDHDVATPLRVCHFLAQAAHETDGFRTLEEYGGPAYFARYEGRRDLGNSEAGDGARYHGRGIFQLTGRSNYRRFGQIIGIDLEARPERAKEPETSLMVAFAYWRERACNAAADRDDIAGVTRLINGGRNGLAERTRYLAKAKEIWL
ncbi:glycoside hydrolase family 19 protein [Bosea sp. (in: a-proteobacteria)]|uniref:glycoside hydrolase family 19 protein n=1 Tax=Bosea sp. (in: a-proteobacteria) TaxID=1871050 RepID=UPI00261483C6|nr:glycoside hydrolase family 19 protein [Bosea sp. (in: a-proteobacteria)]MCO5090776.1 peptidoglycan-binding protein [Bosea sp. (in: a-proteobacteria)]